MLMMGELQAGARTALIDGHTWKQGHFALLFCVFTELLLCAVKLVFKIDKKEPLNQPTQN